MFGGRVFLATHRGAVRSENQDALVSRPDIGVFAIADGAGGHQDGKLAARTVIDSIATIPSQLAAADRLSEVRRRIWQAHELLTGHESADRSVSNAATTVAALLLDGPYFVCLWAGDSRIYVWRAGDLLQLTRDHSLVQEMLDAGTLAPSEARFHPKSNVITRAVGAGGSDLQIEKRIGQAKPGDRFLLCSDGLNKIMDDDEICQMLGGSGDVASMMLSTALRRRARDNVSIIVACRD